LKALLEEHRQLPALSGAEREDREMDMIVNPDKEHMLFNLIEELEVSSRT